LNPGKKLHEEVLHLSETLQPTHHPRVMRGLPSIDSIRLELDTALSSNEVVHIKQAIKKYVPEYTPYLD
jgi:hypothetical protein